MTITTSWFWPSCSERSHWRRAAAPQLGWRSRPRAEGGSWRTGTAASAASAGRWEASDRPCNRLERTQRKIQQLQLCLFVVYGYSPVCSGCLATADVVADSDGDVPAAPPSAFPRVELMMWTLSITPSSSSVPLRDTKTQYLSLCWPQIWKHFVSVQYNNYHREPKISNSSMESEASWRSDFLGTLSTRESGQDNDIVDHRTESKDSQDSQTWRATLPADPPGHLCTYLWGFYHPLYILRAAVTSGFPRLGINKVDLI